MTRRYARQKGPPLDTKPTKTPGEPTLRRFFRHRNGKLYDAWDYGQARLQARHIVVTLMFGHSATP